MSGATTANQKPTTNRQSDSHRRGRRDSYLRHAFVHLDPQNVLEYWSEKPPLSKDKEADSHLTAKYAYKYDGKVTASKSGLRQKAP